MAKDKDSNYVSVGFWMFALFVMVIPCVGPIMTLIWAFTGDNDTRKNYFRAVLVWWLILFAVLVGIAVFGNWPEIQKQLPIQIHRSK